MIYGFLSTIAFGIALPFWLLLGVFKPKLVYGIKEKMGFFSAPTLKPQKTLLFYGVSVGEVIAMENLIKKTRASFPDINILLLTGTKTGQEIAHKKFAGICDFITYFPLDFPFCINNMLKKLEPDAIFVMETELWPNFATVVNKKKIPLFIINGRISDRTYKSYKKLAFFFKPILEKYTAIYTQSAQDNEKLISVGANPYTTKIMGNLKFDILKPDIKDLNFLKNPEHKIFLAGSTHAGEDEIITAVFVELRKEIPNIKLILAPRHPERNTAVFELSQNTGLSCAKRSDNATFEENDIILLDTMGELGRFYSVCDVAFIGGSFNKTGGHNPLEATIFEKPVLSGPSVHNFKDIYALLTNSRAGKIVKDGIELKKELKTLLLIPEIYKTASDDCKIIFDQNHGAVDFIQNIITTIV